VWLLQASPSSSRVVKRCKQKNSGLLSPFLRQVAAGYTTFIPMGDGGGAGAGLEGVRALRALRALRPLRTITR
jgi:hypothetical protein